MSQYFFFERNRNENPDRNFYTWKKKNGKDPSAVYTNGEVEDFFYAVVDKSVMGENVRAQFYSLERTIMLRTDFRPQSFLDAVVSYHEHVHAMQDTEKRKRFVRENAFDRYLAFHHPVDKQSALSILVQDEAEAYMLELLTIDAVSGGEFRRLVQHDTKGIASLGKKLGVEEEHIPNFAFFGNLGKVVFGTGSTPGNLSPDYLKSLARWYRSQGYMPYIETPSLTFEPMIVR